MTTLLIFLSSLIFLHLFFYSPRSGADKRKRKVAEDDEEEEEDEEDASKDLPDTDSKSNIQEVPVPKVCKCLSPCA